MTTTTMAPRTRLTDWSRMGLYLRRTPEPTPAVAPRELPAPRLVRRRVTA